MTKKKLTYTPEEYLGKEFSLPDFKRVKVITHRVIGCCPVSVEGDEWVFDGPIFYLDEGKITFDVPGFAEGGRQICFMAAKSLLHYMFAMQMGVSAVDMGIAKSGEDGYVICPAWGPPTCEAVVIYKLHPEPMEKLYIDNLYESLAKAGHISVPTYYFEKYASPETKAEREKQIEEWQKAGSPKFWEGFRNPPCQPKPKTPYTD